MAPPQSGDAKVLLMSSPPNVRILCAEDTPATALLLRRRLNRAGYLVDVAPDGAQTLAMHENGDYDVLVVDFELPGLNGLEIIRTLSAKGVLPPTIMITGAGSENVAVEAMKLGADDYIIKDSDAWYLELLPQRVEQALEKRHLIEEKLQAEHALRRAHEELEQRIEDRTAELARANEELKVEIAERKRMESSLRASKEGFRAVFESAQEFICLKDLSLKYSLVNPAMARFLKLPLSGIVGKTDEDLFDKETALALMRLDRRALEGDVVEAEHSVSVNAERFTLLGTRVPLPDMEGRIAGICGIFHDITGRARLAAPHESRECEFRSAAMCSTIAAARMAARSDSVVLLTGESGTGKDYLARYIHEHSERSSGAFHCINCAAIPHDLAETELFGHERGAFTGAQSLTRGLLELAEGGTLLLNEIGELPLPLQAKLLSFLDTWSFVRVGGRRMVKVHARLIAATNRDLQQEVREGRFRADLYYRLNVFAISLPPLRERLEDIPVLVEQLIERLSGELQLPCCPTIGSRVLRELERYHWPGNVRELRNVLERALILSMGKEFTLGPLASDMPDTRGWSFEVDFREPNTLDELLKNFTRLLIEESLRRTGGNKNHAARLLGISRHALRRRMMTVGMTEPDESENAPGNVRIRLTS
jgi:sigma-54 dependent transcriptional regulator, acetoin dehydrogenase operon transcriptional activator AcoR